MPGLPLERIGRLSAPLFGRRRTLPIERDNFHQDATDGDVIRAMVGRGMRDIPLPLLLGVSPARSGPAATPGGT